VARVECKCPSSLQVDTIACVHIESMPSNYTSVQTATTGRLRFIHYNGGLQVHSSLTIALHE
jgi:hypothetical protein